MHFQMALTALLLTSLFAIPVQAVEDDENKKKRAAAKMEQQQTSSPEKRQNAESSRKSEEKADCDSVPANIYDKLDLNSF